MSSLAETFQRKTTSGSHHRHGLLPLPRVQVPGAVEGSLIFSDYARGWVRALFDDGTMEDMIDTGLRYPSGPIDLAVWEGEVYMVVLGMTIKN